MSPNEPASTLTIGQVARRAGLRDSHIRYYERIGVLPEPQRVSGQRRYTEDVLHRWRSSTWPSVPGSPSARSATSPGPQVMASAPASASESSPTARCPRSRSSSNRAQAVRQWLEIARTCDCESVDVCPLFADPALAPPTGVGVALGGSPA